MTNRKSHTRFRLEPKSTILDDLKGPLRTLIRPALLYSIILPLVAFPMTPKYMTLNDCEWREWPFYVNFSLLIRTVID